MLQINLILEVSSAYSLTTPLGKKGYRVMALDTKKCYISRDVIFVENIFPFQSHSNTITHSSLFPAENSIAYSNTPLYVPIFYESPV